jgi:hypothetical protein
MELIVMLVFFLAIGVAAQRWGVDTREQHNNWDRV